MESTHVTGEPSWIALDGAVNARDLGGLATRDGRRTAPRRLLRSDNLQGLSARDVRLLVDELALRTVVDLRSSAEVALEGPGPLAREPVDHLHCSVMPEAGGRTDVQAGLLPAWRAALEIPDRDEAMPGDLYLAYLYDRPESVLRALRAIVATPGTALVHCAAGKDRTGMLVALALETAGVRRELIVADYLATAARIEAIFDRLTASATYAQDLRGRSPHAHRPRPATMEQALATLDERHGGAAGWLEEIGFAADEQETLRARLLDGAG